MHITSSTHNATHADTTLAAHVKWMNPFRLLAVGRCSCVRPRNGEIGFTVVVRVTADVQQHADDIIDVERTFCLCICAMPSQRRMHCLCAPKIGCLPFAHGRLSHRFRSLVLLFPTNYRYAGFEPLAERQQRRSDHEQIIINLLSIIATLNQTNNSHIKPEAI